MFNKGIKDCWADSIAQVFIDSNEQESILLKDKCFCQYTLWALKQEIKISFAECLLVILT